MGRRRQDAFGKRARREGHAARSVYKLEEIDRRCQLIRRGDRVLDLGAAPGSWSQYTAKKIGPGGFLLAIDLQPIELAFPPHVEVREGDARELDPETLEPFDVVISDMAPKTSGTRSGDQFRSYELFMSALQSARALCKPGGKFVGKIFQGPDIEEARAAVKRAFRKARTLRPEAVRKESYEVFLVGLERRETDLPDPAEAE